MTVKEFLQNYGGNECVSNNPNHYKPTCIAEESWWNEVKDREIKEWNIIGGGMYKVELWIDLEE